MSEVVGGQSAFRHERDRLAADLRGAREAARLTTRQLAERLGASQSYVTHIENGRRGVTAEGATAWARAAGLSDEQAAELAERAGRAQTDVANWRRVLRPGGPGLAGPQREVGDLEQRAGVILNYELLIVPGLLQTAEYARRVFLAEVPDAEAAAAAVAARVERQAVLYNLDKRIELLIYEGALRWRMGPASVQAAQLDRIRQAATLGNVYVGVVPVDVEAPIWRYHGFLLLDGLSDDEPAQVQVETRDNNLTVTEPGAVERYRQSFRQLQEVAATGDELAAILDRAAADSA